MGFWEDAGEALFGTQTKAQGQQNAQAGQSGMASGQSGLTAGSQAAAGVGGQARGMTERAQQMGQGYDVGAQQSMGANAADYMKKAQGAAQELASQQAQQASTKGTQQALRAARSSGLNAGQAALTSGQQAADVYQNALAQGTQQGIQNYMGATGQFAGQGAEMAGRANQGIQNQLGATGQQIQAAGQQGQIGASQMSAGAQQQQQAAQTAQNTWGAIMNAAGTAGQLIASDVNLKKNIEPLLDKVMGKKSSNLDAILAKIDPVKFDYKGEPNGTGHLGTIAQQVEESPLKNAVVDTPNGKALDTAELSASYLPIIIELASRVKALEGKK